MFNSPRPAQRYGASNGFGGSYVEDNGPLATSVYDTVDPWSAAPTPSPPPIPGGPASTFSSIGTPEVIGGRPRKRDVPTGDAVAPAIYNKAFSAVDSSGTGEVSVSALSRVVGTSGLPAAMVDRVRLSPLPPLIFYSHGSHGIQIVNLVSSKPRVSKLEFFVALALVALAQLGKGGGCRTRIVEVLTISRRYQRRASSGACVV
jgi:sorting nexin-8